MSATLLHALILIGALGGLIILIGASVRMGWWIVTGTIAGMLHGIRYTGWFLWTASRQTAAALQRCITFVLVSIWLLFRKGVRTVFDGLARATSPVLARMRARLFGWQETLRSDAPGESAAGDEEEPPQWDEQPEGSSGNVYAEAIALLGLEDVGLLTAEILRARYRDLIQRVHPDKGFPSRAFAQQVNAAVRTIKAAHGWK